MAKWKKLVGALLATLTVAAFVAVFVLPREAEVRRTITIDAPRGVVFAQVADLQAYQSWSPWAAADPTMKVVFGDKTVGQGASYTWSGEAAGTGEMTIIEATEPNRIVNELSFGDLGGGTATWTFEDADQGTLATWTVRTEASGLFAGVFALMADSTLGPSFEDGLQRLKKVAEERN